MPDRPQPDESSGVPMCSEKSCGCWECYRDSNGSWPDCRADENQVAHDDEICLPRVRELVQISRRRCGTCDNYRRRNYEDGGDHCVGGGLRGMIDATRYCSRWEGRHG